MLWKCYTQYASKFGKVNSGHRTGKGQFACQSQKKGNAEEYSNYHTIALISHGSKVMLSSPTRLQQYVNCKLTDVQTGFRKGRGTRDQIAKICWIIEKARDFQKKHLILLYCLSQSLWLYGSQQAVKNSSTGGNTRPSYLPPQKSVCRSRRNS